jgi:hypothetical protein
VYLGVELGSSTGGKLIQDAKAMTVGVLLFVIIGLIVVGLIIGVVV